MTPAELAELLRSTVAKEFVERGLDTQVLPATLTVERMLARLTAQTYSFVRVEPSALVAHYEVVYDVTGAGVRSLALSFAESTPDALSITALDGVAIKEFRHVQALQSG